MTEQRIKKIQQFLKINEALLIASPANRFYFTGFKSSAGTVLITKNNSWFLIDFRYFEKANNIVKSSNVILAEKTYLQINNILKDEKCKILYIETDFTSIDLFKTYTDYFENIKVSKDNTLTNKIKTIRSIKTSNEISLIKKAQELTDDTFTYILNYIKPGLTEKQIMLEMEFYIRKNGSEGVSFDFIVVSGKNSSLPHGVPTDKIIENGDFITMDFGAVVEGYHSDMTRTIAIGKVTDKQKEVYYTVLKAQNEAIAKMKPGIKCNEIDKTARDIIYNAGYKGCFGHGFGHSVGIEIHENPSCNTICGTPLQSGIVMTAEPGIYIENQFGVRIEDMIIITNDGNEDITNSKKELIIL